MTWKKKLIRTIVIIIIITLVLFCALYSYYLSDRRHFPGVYPSTIDRMIPVDQLEPADITVDSEAVIDRQQTLENLAQVNERCIAWLLIPGTVIDVPIIQGTDNSYYFTHGMDGQADTHDAVFLDCCNTANFTDALEILFGTDQEKCKSLGGMLRFQDADYFDDHSYGFLITQMQVMQIHFLDTVPMIGNSLQDLLLLEDKDIEQQQAIIEEFPALSKAEHPILIAATSEEGKFHLLLGDIID